MQEKGYRSFPIIFMTGYRDKELMYQAKKINPLGYFINPVGLNDLKPSLDTIMNKTTPNSVNKEKTSGAVPSSPFISGHRKPQKIYERIFVFFSPLCYDFFSENQGHSRGKNK